MWVVFSYKTSLFFPTTHANIKEYTMSKKNRHVGKEIVEILKYSQELKKDDSLNRVEKMAKVLDKVVTLGLHSAHPENRLWRDSLASLLSMISDDLGLTPEEDRKACVLQITSRLGDLSKIIKKQVEEEADDVDFGLINDDDSDEDDDEDDEDDEVSVKTLVHEITFDKDGKPIDKTKTLNHIPKRIRERIIELLREAEE